MKKNVSSGKLAVGKKCCECNNSVGKVVYRCSECKKPICNGCRKKLTGDVCQECGRDGE